MNEQPGMRDWADMRMFLAIVDHGNLSSAAEHVGLSQPTLGRRLAALEQRMNVSLFVRTPRAMKLSDAGRAILENARRMEREMLAIEKAVDVESRGLCGEVRISATEGTGTDWLAPEMMDFHLRHPDIQIYIQVENSAADLLHREADIALRLGRPTEPDLIARPLVTVGFGLYASESYIERHGELTSLDQLVQHRMVGLATGAGHVNLNPGAELAGTGQFVFVSNSPAAQIAAARAGYGVAVLSHRWASMYPELRHLIPRYTATEVQMWLVTHEELRHSARIRAVCDFLIERIVSSQAAFAAAMR